MYFLKPTTEPLCSMIFKNKVPVGVKYTLRIVQNKDI